MLDFIALLQSFSQPIKSEILNMGGVFPSFNVIYLEITEFQE